MVGNGKNAVSIPILEPARQGNVGILSEQQLPWGAIKEGGFTSFCVFDMTKFRTKAQKVNKSRVHIRNPAYKDGKGKSFPYNLCLPFDCALGKTTNDLILQDQIDDHDW